MKPDVQLLKRAMLNPSNVRNVCILAHVDHGKTTIADSLLATNGLISKRSAGQIRYLDDRRDEQERGITMKSSAVSLYYSPAKDDDCLINVIDTPGHIDFSSEVAAAVRICDSALIIVDVVEGVCVQTRDAIKQAYEEHVKMVLVLNKIDRLIVELHKSEVDVFQSILRVIENCNVIITELCRYDVSEDESEEFLFSASKGNVIFASAIDGWGVTTKKICEMFVNNGLIKGETIDSLNTKMWDFDNYVDSTSKLVVPGAIEKRKENLFIQLFIKTVYYVYYTLVIRMDRDKVSTILKKLKIDNQTREMKHNDPRIQVKAIMQAWSPIAETIMKQCRDIIPSPVEITEKKLRYLVCNNRYLEDDFLYDITKKMMSDMKLSNGDGECIVYVSKMFSVNKKNLSQNQAKAFVSTLSKQEVIMKLSEKLDNLAMTGTFRQGHVPETLRNGAENDRVQKDNTDEEDDVDDNQENPIIALGRVFSGQIKVGDEIYVLRENFNGSNIQDDVESEETVKIVIKELYVVLGRDLLLTDAVTYGNICAIGGLEDVIIRTATLSSNMNYLPLAERSQMEPIVRNTLEPANPKNFQKLRRGLKLLMQSDSCVKVVMQETGEHVLVTAGDVHLAKCLEDLRNKFIDFEVNVSKPMVSLRETIIGPAKRIDVPVSLPEFGVTANINVVPLPVEISEFVRANYDLMRMIEEHKLKSEGNSREKVFQNEHTKELIVKLKEQLPKTFASVKNSSFWKGFADRIWSVGKLRDSINILFNNTDDYARNIFGTIDEKDPRSKFDHCFVNGFEMCCHSGPICDEPLFNCAFFVNDYKLEVAERSDFVVQAIANVSLATKNSFREAFSRQTEKQRLMEPIFVTDIQTNTTILGKVYSVVSKRHGKVLEAVGMDDKEKTFMVKAQIPIMESDGFANEIRKTTSGQANPNLRFSHYEIVEGDPYKEETCNNDEEDAPVETSAGRANRLMKEIRRRKGLLVDEQVVIHAEKQRTLNKKK